MRMLLDREQKRATFAGTHYKVENAPNNPKPLQPRAPIWIGGRGEKRTLRAAARNADGWNAPYIGPDEWTRKSKVLTRWCESEGRDPPRGGFLRGTPDQVMDLIAAYRDAGYQRVNIAFRDGPYDWEALHAFAERVLPAFGSRRPE